MGESLNTLIWHNNTDGLYSSYAGGSTRTKQLIGTVDPFVEYMTRDGVRISFRNRWQHLVNDNNNNQGNNSDVFYSELQTQKLGAWGLKNMAVTAGIVHQYTISSAELYAGGNEDGENNARNLAGYIQLDQPVGDRLNISLGLRHEFFSVNNEYARDSLRFDRLNTAIPVLGRPVFRSGFNYQFFEETYLRGSVGQGYRFPTIAEKYIRTGLGQLQVYPNLDLLPETSTSLELGVKQGVKLKEFMGYFDLAVFQQEYSNFIEFTWGRWNPESNDIADLYGFGFRSLNTGKSRVRGIEGSIMGRAQWGPDNKYSIDLLTGYTYTNPVCLTPNFNYNTDTSSAAATFIGTSVDTTGYLLKYRSRHLVRFDAQFTMPLGFFGISARYQSAHENYDAAFLELDALLDDPSTEDIDESWGLNDWLGVIDSGIAEGETPTGEFVPYDYGTGQVLEESAYKLPWIWDLRVGFNLDDTQRMSFVVSNLFNKEYAIRPLAIESPRLFNLVYTYEIQ
jgi:iron complex outermembrane receptor protein